MKPIDDKSLGDADISAASKSSEEVDVAGVEHFVAKVGSRVRNARQQKGISRRILSERSGVSQRYLAQLESGLGNISVGLLYRVCVALNIDPANMLLIRDGEGAKFAQMFDAADADQQAAALRVLKPKTAFDCKAQRICLLGLRGAGKSTLGRLLALELGLPFVELNSAIEEQCGMPVSELIALYGQEGYRELEKPALNSIVESETAVVLAVGGGIVSEPSTLTLLLESFHSIWLKAKPEEHMDRVRRQGDIRPMAENPKAMDELRSILTSREALYSQADAMVDTSGQLIDASLKQLVSVARSMID